LRGKYWLFGKDTWVSQEGWTWSKSVADIWDLADQATVLFKDKVWMYGGTKYVDDSEADECYDLFDPQNSINYTEDGVNWTVVEHGAFEPRLGQTCVVWNGALWMVGGRDNRRTFNDVWRSKDGLRWERVSAAAPFSPRWKHSSFVFHGRLWIAGGMDEKGFPIKDVWSYAE